MRRFSILALLLGVFVSCINRGNGVDDDTCLTLNLDELSDMAPTIKDLLYLPLETNDSCLIADVDKILFMHNRFYIFDKQEKTVYIFDDNGKFVHKIRAIGNGPGEYIAPSDIDIDEEGNVYIADNPRKTIIKYPLDNTKPIETIEVGDYFLDFIIADSNYIYLGDMARDGKMNIKLARFDRITHTVNIIETDERIDSDPIPFFANHYFFRSRNNTLYYYKRFSQAISIINGGIVKEQIILNSNKYPSEDIIEKWKIRGIKAMSEDYKYIRDISGCYETSNSIFITTQTSPLLYTIVNKQNGSVYNVFSLKDKRCCGNMVPMAVSDNYFISYCLPTSNNIKRIVSNNAAMDKERKKSISLLTEDCNPILILYRFDFD